MLLLPRLITTLFWSFLFSASAVATTLTGAGASFPYPIYAKWASSYKQSHGVSVNYQSIGSGGGIKQIKARTVDFGATDMPMTAEELREAKLMQFPAIIGGVVPVMNLPGLTPGKFKLTGPLLADIYLGKITRWNDPKIVAINPGLTLPEMDITVVVRADGSGTSYVFTSYLSKTSPAFKEGIGVGSSLKWPVGIGGKGNEGVAANVQKIKGAVGYVEYAYAKKNALPHAQLQNRDSHFVEPTQASFQSAAAAADWAHTPGFAVDFTDAPGKESWPISSASFVLLPPHHLDDKKGQGVLKFFSWAFEHGGKDARALDYVPLPDNVIQLVEDAWKNEGAHATGQAVK